jgi:signal transduction histidine kinase
VIGRIRLRAARPGSLRRRLVWGAALLAAVAVLAAQTIGFLVLRSWLLDRVDQQLDDFVASQQAIIEDTDPDQMPQPPPPNPGSVTLPSDFRVTFYDAAGHRRGTLGDDTAAGPDLPDSAGQLRLADGQVATVTAASGDGRWRIRKDTGPDHTAYVVALPLDTLDDATSTLLWLNGIVLAATLAGLIAFSRWVVRIGLLPLTRMERTAQDITATDPGLRLPDTDPRTEIGRLGTVLNTMLDRLEQALRERELSQARLRRFVADAGHELRTPLTSLRTNMELLIASSRPGAPRIPDEDMAGLRADVMAQIEELSTLVGDLVDLAREDAPETVYERVDLGEVVERALERARRRRTGIEFVADLRPWFVYGHEAGLERAVLNVLDNAAKWSPAGAQVRILMRESGPGLLELSIDDAGPGIPAAERELVFERFYRVMSSRSMPGSGLGLAIVKQVVTKHGGTIAIDTSQRGGAVVRIVLPGEPGAPVSD